MQILPLKGHFDKLDPELRIAISAFCVALSLFCAWVGLQRLVGGPWYLALLAGFMSALSVNVMFLSWPKKLPDPIALALEKWDKVKARSSKSPAGRFVWNMGRSAIAAMLSATVISAATDVTGILKFLMVGGFSVAVGYFGIRAAVWTGIALYFIAYQLAYAGLAVDISDPGSRTALSIAWSNGGSMSWWWPLGLVAVLPIWIGTSWLSVVIGNKIVEEMAERQEAALAKGKIDARRLRLRTRRESGSSNDSDEAKKMREKAQGVLESVAHGKSPKFSTGEGPEAKMLLRDIGTELNGVERIEQDRIKMKLQKFITHVLSIRKSERNEIDINTPARRSFDRAVQNLSDSELKFLRDGSLTGWSDLDKYYNQLCNLEASAMVGNDGEIVSTYTVPDESTETTSDEAPLHFSKPARSNGASDDDLDDERYDDVTEDKLPAPAFANRRATLGDNLVAMLSEPKGVTPAMSAGPDGTPVTSSKLPTIQSETNDETAAVKTTASEEAFTSNEQLLPEDLDDDEDIQPQGSHTLDNAKAGADAQSDDLSHRTENDGSAGADDSEAGQESAETQTEGSGGGENGAAGTSLSNDSLSDPETAASGGSDDPDNAKTVSDADKKNAAAIILSRGYDRNFVMTAMAYFDSPDDAAATLGVEAAMFADPFEAFSAKVKWARVELRLADLLNSDDADEVRTLFEEINGSEWEINPELQKRTEDWIKQKDEEARQRAEALRLEEEERLRLEQEARDRAAAEAAREEEARLEKIRADEEAQKAAALAEEAAAREKELAGNRKRFGFMILVQNYSDELMSAGDGLFPTVETLSEALGTEVELVQEAFSAYTAKRFAHEQVQQLLAAWEAQDLYLAQTLLENPEFASAFETRPDVVEGVREWVRSEEKKEKLLGIKEVVDFGEADTKETAKRLMRKMLKTSDAHVNLIDNVLPTAMAVSKSIGDAVELLGSNVNAELRGQFEAAQEKVYQVAAAIVANEKECQGYVRSFFPKVFRKDDVDVWDMLVDLGSRASGTYVDDMNIEPDNVETSHGDDNAEGFAPRPADVEVVPELRDVSLVDPQEEFKNAKFKKPKNMEDYQVSFNMTCNTVMNFSANPTSSLVHDGKNGYSLYLGEHNGVTLGRIKIVPHVAIEPIWYHEKTDVVYTVNHATGAIELLDGPKYVARLDFGFSNTEGGERDDVKGLVLTYPNITDDGIRSFEPLLAKLTNKGPIIIQKETLSTDAISALVADITGP